MNVMGIKIKDTKSIFNKKKYLWGSYYTSSNMLLEYTDTVLGRRYTRAEVFTQKYRGNEEYNVLVRIYYGTKVRNEMARNQLTAGIFRVRKWKA